MTDDHGRWSRYATRAVGAGVIKTAYDAWTHHIPTLSHLIKVKPPPARVLSIGCGVGLLDVLLEGWGYSVTSIDSDPQVLEAARMTARHLGVELDLVLGDAFDLRDHHDKYDIAYSGGLVEHWHGQRTVELLREHARCAPIVQVEVPTVHTRLLVNAWQEDEVLADAHLFRPREFVRQVRSAGLEVLRLYPVGDLPTLRYRTLKAVLPPYVWSRIRTATGYTMGLGCVTRRR